MAMEVGGPAQTSRKPARSPRAAIYKELSAIRSELEPLTIRSLSADALQSIRIDCTMMSFEEDPEFCSLCPRARLNEAFRNIPLEEKPEWPDHDPEWNGVFYSALSVGYTLLKYTESDYLDWLPSGSTGWRQVRASSRDLTFHTGFYPDYKHQWGLGRIFRVGDMDQPHLACLFLDDAPAIEDLRPSELWCMITLMKQAVRLDKKSRYQIHPIFVYSITDHKARILQAYLDLSTHRLNVRKTAYLDFEDDNEEQLKRYLRWMVSKPSGVTSFDPLTV